MAKDDFWVGFLQGLHQAGVGNPQANRARRYMEMQEDQSRQAREERMLERGYVPKTGLERGRPAIQPQAEPRIPLRQGIGAPPEGSSYYAPQAQAGKPDPDSPTTGKKIGGFIMNLLYPQAQFGSRGLQQEFVRDPNAPKYYQRPTGEFGLSVGQPVPEGTQRIPQKYGITGLAAQRKAETSAGEKKTEKLKPNVVLKMNEGKAVARMLPDVETAIKATFGKYGPVTGKMGKWNPYDIEAQSFDAQMRAASQAFGRFMEGGVLRKEDEDKYRRMFPQIDDADGTKVSKLAVVRRILAQRYEDDRKTLGRAGYDISPFGKLNIPKSIFEDYRAPKKQPDTILKRTLKSSDPLGVLGGF